MNPRWPLRVGIALLLACGARTAAAAEGCAVTTDGRLLCFHLGLPGVATRSIPVGGLSAGETVVGLDMRPATGELYALSSGGRLLRLDRASGQASPVDASRPPLPVAGSTLGFDFDPVQDLIRVVGSSGVNVLVSPDTGGVVRTGTTIASTVDIGGLAYTANFAGAAATTAYAIDAAANQLVRVGGVEGAPSPDGGTITAIGPLGVDADAVAGFDIDANTRTPYAVWGTAGATTLYSLDLGSGTAAPRGGLPAGVSLAAFTVVSRAVPIYMLSPENRLSSILSARPATALIGTYGPEKTISGLVELHETLQAIDVRPATGELYGIGRSRLYRIDPVTGVATPLTAARFTPEIDEVAAFDFDPVSDRIRAVSRAGMHIRLHPDTGLVAAVDAPLPANAITGLCYSSNVDGATATTAFGIDTVNAQWVRLGGADGMPDPSLGAVTAIGPLGVAANRSCDISPVDDTAFATTFSGHLLVVDLATGAATDIGEVAGGGLDLAVYTLDFTLAEGSTGTFFSTDLALANPYDQAVPVVATFLRDDGHVVTTSRTLAARSRATIDVSTLPGLEGAAFSTSVTSPAGLPVTAERTMRWGEGGYGMHSERAIPHPARTWYFAEGSQGFFDTFVLLANPQPRTNTATLRFLLEGGAVVTRSYVLGPRSRTTVHAGGIPELVHRSFGIVVEFAIAAAAERAMYFGSPLFRGGHESAGVVRPSTTWFMPEGATGSFFSLFVLLLNPGDAPATVSLTYHRLYAPELRTVKIVPPHSRLTVNVALEHLALADAAIATHVTSDVPVVAERAQYWPGAPDGWEEAHNSFGVQATSQRWVLAEGRVGGPERYQTFILLANPNGQEIPAYLRFLRTTGAPVDLSVSMPGNSRRTIAVGPGTEVPELNDESFGVLVFSGLTASGTSVVVERAMYSDANGVMWAAGSSATGTPMP